MIPMLLASLLATFPNFAPSEAALASASRGAGIPSLLDPAVAIADGVFLKPSTCRLLLVVPVPGTPLVLFHDDGSTLDAAGLGPGWGRSFGQRLQWGARPRLVTDDGAVIELEPATGGGFRGRAEEGEARWTLTVAVDSGRTVARACDGDHGVEFDVTLAAEGEWVPAAAVTRLRSGLRAAGTIERDGGRLHIASDRGGFAIETEAGAVIVRADGGPRWALELDAAGRLARIRPLTTDPAAAAIELAYGADGRIARMREASGATIEVKREDGELTAIAGPAGTTSIRREPAAHRTTLRAPDGRTTVLEFDAADRACLERSEDGRVLLEREIDGEGRPLREVTEDGERTFEYAADGSFTVRCVTSAAAHAKS